MSAKDRIEPHLPKCPTGIKGLDEITRGGFPKGRPTLLAGNAGSGKTLVAMEFMKVRPNMPIILCTGFSPKISAEKAKKLGIKAFAIKPLVRRDMANIVRKVLDGGRIEV